MLEKYKNIVVRMPNWLGDIVMATPVLEDLRYKYPKARITAMCQSSGARLLENNPFIDDIFIYKRPKFTLWGNDLSAIIEEIKNKNFDLGILLTNSFSSAFWFWRASIKYSLGYAGNARNFLMDKALPFPDDVRTQHLVETYKMVLSPLGISVSDSAPLIKISYEEEMVIEEFIKNLGILKDDIVIGFNPSAAYGDAKCWLPERFVELAQRLLINDKIKICLLGDDKGEFIVTEIYKAIGSKNVFNLSGQTSLRQLSGLINRCDLFITNDSGPMHIAAALNTPLIAIFGSTNDVTTGPYKFGNVIHKHVKCSPCYKRSCPLDFACMTSISVDEVYNKALEIL